MSRNARSLFTGRLPPEVQILAEVIERIVLALVKFQVAATVWRRIGREGPESNVVQFSCGYQSLPIDHPLGCTGPQSHAAPFEGVGEQLGVSATILARWFEQDKLFGPERASSMSIAALLRIR